MREHVRGRPPAVRAEGWDCGGSDGWIWVSLAYGAGDASGVVALRRNRGRHFPLCVGAVRAVSEGFAHAIIVVVVVVMVLGVVVDVAMVVVPGMIMMMVVILLLLLLLLLLSATLLVRVSQQSLL